MDISTALFLIQAGHSVYKHLNPDRRSELVNDVLASQTQFRDSLARRAFGNFTAAERQQIQAASEPQVNQVAGNVSARGLGTSGAGGQIIAQAQQAPFQHAQQQAMGFLPSANNALLSTANLLPQGDAVTSLLGSLQKKVALFNEDQETNLTFQMLFDMLMGREPGQEQQGYSMPNQMAFQQRGTLQPGGGRV